MTEKKAYFIEAAPLTHDGNEDKKRCFGWKDAQKILYASDLEALAREWEGQNVITIEPDYDAPCFPEGSKGETPLDKTTLLEIRETLENTLNLVYLATTNKSIKTQEVSFAGITREAVCFPILIRQKMEKDTPCEGARTHPERAFKWSGEGYKYLAWLMQNSRRLNKAESAAMPLGLWEFPSFVIHASKEEASKQYLLGRVFAPLDQGLEVADGAAKNAALRAAYTAISLHIAGATSAFVDGKVHNVCQDGLSSIWLDIARKIEGGARLYRCETCGRFEFAERERGVYLKRHCSNACKTWKCSNKGRGKTREPRPYKSKVNR